MADTGTHSSRSMRIDQQTTLSLALVIALVGGGIQYGRQSQRLESVERELIEIKATLKELTSALASAGLHVTTSNRR